MKPYTITRVLLCRFLLPLSMLTAVVFKQNLLSLVYFLLVVVGPLIKPPRDTFGGQFKGYLIICLLFSILSCVAQFVFQMYLLVDWKIEDKPYGAAVGNCSDLEETLALIGLLRYAPAYEAQHTVRLIVPDLMVLIFAIITYLATSKAYKMGQRAVRLERERGVVDRTFESFGEFIIIGLLGVCGATIPSFLSLVYYILFFGITLHWCLLRPIHRRSYSIFKMVLFAYVVCHMCILYIAQLPKSIVWVEAKLGDNKEYYSRLFGIHQLLLWSCEEPWAVHLSDYPWPYYLNPILLFVLFTAISLDFAYQRKTNILCTCTSSQSEQERTEFETVNDFPLDPACQSYNSDQEMVGLDPLVFTRNTERTSSERQLLRNENVAGYDTIPAAEMNRNTPVPSRTTLNPRRRSSVLGVGIKFIDRPVFRTIGSWLKRQLYLLSLIVMMIWSVVYPSWTAFVLLVIFCLIFLIPDSHKAALYLSPFITMYSIILCFLQYTWSFNMGGIHYQRALWFHSDNSSTINNSTLDMLKTIGLTGYDYPTVVICIKTLFTAIFITLLRDFVQAYQRAQRYAEENSTTQTGICMISLSDQSVNQNEDSEEPVEQNWLQIVGGKLQDLLERYWIIIFSIGLLVMAILEPYIYRLVYMFLFLFYAISFQLSFKWWRLILRWFLIFVVFYSMLAMFTVYILSFHDVLLNFQNSTGLNDEQMSDLGFDPSENYQKGNANFALLQRLVVPAFLLIAVMLQLHLFHPMFMHITQWLPHTSTLQATIPEQETQESDETGQKTLTTVLFSRYSSFKARTEAVKNFNTRAAKIISKFLRILLDRSVCFLDIHFYRITCIITAFVVTQEISAMGFVLFGIMVTSLFNLNSRRILKVYILISQFFLGIFIIAKMMFQLQTVQTNPLFTNCTTTGSMIYRNGSDKTDAFKWLGLRTLHTGESLPQYIGGYIGILICLTCVAAFRITQRLYTILHEEHIRGVVFGHINYNNYDDDVMSLIKYLINFGFYRFGIEITMMVSAIVISYRQDGIGITYSILLMISLCLYLIRRSILRKYWIIHIAILWFLIVVQYVSALGLPHAACFNYPWTEKIPVKWRIWLYLPDYDESTGPDGYLLFGDFIQLLFVALQWSIFKLEKKADSYDKQGVVNPDPASRGDNISSADRNPLTPANEAGTDGDTRLPIEVEFVKRAGSNKELNNKIPKHWNSPGFLEGNDFTGRSLRYIDMVKRVVFNWWFWMSIAIVFITGTQNINIYCLGYLIFCFYLGLHGADFTMKPFKKVIRVWNFLLIYNTSVILIKTVLQLVSCIYLEEILERSQSQTDDKPHCVLAEMFSMKCLNKKYQDTPDVLCGVSVKEAGLTWDIVCFVMLLLQRRIFLSSYFQLVVCDDRSQSCLASRGGQLINQMLVTKIDQQNHAEKKDLAKIKKRIEKIRDRVRRLEGEDRELWSHENVIRSASKHMLQEYSDDESTEDGSDLHEPLNEIHDDRDGAERDEKSSVIKQTSPAQLDATSATSMTSEQADSFTEFAEESSDLDHPPIGTPQIKLSLVPSEEAIAADVPTAGSLSPGIPATKPTPAPSTSSYTPSQAVDCERCHDDKEESVGKGEELETKLIMGREIGVVRKQIMSIVDYLNNMSRDFVIVAERLNSTQIPVKRRMVEMMIEMGIDESYNYKTDSKIQDLLSMPASQPSKNREIYDSIMKRVEDKSLFYRFLRAFIYAVFARTEFVCYFAMILCHLCYGNLLSIPLPLLAITWGMFSLPRPAKRFWITILTYTMAVVIVKYVFQFQFYPWSKNTIINWYDWRLITGISDGTLMKCSVDDDVCQNESKTAEEPYYATYELILLLCVFIHRSLLKSYGLWRNETEQTLDIDNLRKNSAEARRQGLLDAAANQPQKDPPQEASPLQVEQDPRETVRDTEPADEVAVVLTGEDGEISVIQREPEDPAAPSSRGCCDPISSWWRYLLSGEMSAKGDFYSLMFACDFINFFISVFAFSDFGPPQYGNVQDYFQESRIPPFFLILLLLQFVFIFIDRALYLKKSIKGRLVFHVLLVIIVHAWIFILLPNLTTRSFVDNKAAQFWYFFKCLYFGLSAWQIKSGYPTRVLGNFITKRYSMVRLVFFKIFLLVPFLQELRCVMDWMLTSSSMALGSWFTMEDIFAKIYVLKCWRVYEKQYPTPRGRNRSTVIKYIFGTFVLICLILIVWFPLVLFSFANEVYLPNPPVECSATVSIGGFQDIFTAKTQPSQVANITESQLSDFKSFNIKSAPATGFLDVYSVSDIRTVHLDGLSSAVWGITEPNLDSLIKAVTGNDSLIIFVTLAFTRLSKKGLTAGTISTQFEYTLQPGSVERTDISEILRKNTSSKEALIPNFLPRYIRLPKTGVPSDITALNCEQCSKSRLAVGGMPYSNLTMKLNTTESSGANWWEVGESYSHSQEFPPKIKAGTAKSLYFVTFSDRVAPVSFQFITGPGILGLYVSIVVVIGQFVRTLTSGGAYTIIYEELPCVNRVMRLIQSLYLARENNELELEEDLYARLIYLFRSPKMLMAWTKKKVD